MKKILLLGLLAQMGNSVAESEQAHLEAMVQPGEKYSINLDALNNQKKGIVYEDDMLNKGFDSGTYYVFVSASGSHAISSGTEYDYSGAGCINEVGAGGSFDLNVNLPDGHSILGVRYYFYDSADLETSSVTLYQFDGAGGLDSLHTVTSNIDTGYGYLYEGLSGGTHEVNNANGAYVLRFYSTDNTSGQRMCGARLFMTTN